jgi:hypothetical protein
MCKHRSKVENEGYNAEIMDQTEVDYPGEKVKSGGCIDNMQRRKWRPN